MTRIEAEREDILDWCKKTEYELVLMWNEDITQSDTFIQELIEELDQCNKCLNDYLQATKILSDPADIEREINFLKFRLKDNRPD